MCLEYLNYSAKEKMQTLERWIFHEEVFLFTPRPSSDMSCLFYIVTELKA